MATFYPIINSLIAITCGLFGYRLSLDLGIRKAVKYWNKSNLESGRQYVIKKKKVVDNNNIIFHTKHE